MNKATGLESQNRENVKIDTKEGIAHFNNRNDMSYFTWGQWRPFITLLKKEVIRFLTVSLQTLLAPTVTASLYLFIFGVNLGRRINFSEDFSFIEFVIPGLVLMGVINNSFQNTASSLFVSRYLNNIVDILVTPITAVQFILAYTLAAMLRGLLVGSCVWLVSLFFHQMPWANPVAAIGMALLASFLFSQFGLIAAILSNTFDHLSMFTNFLIVPLIFLGGVFYPISSLPGIWEDVSYFNPLFYLIDGFRHGMMGHGEVSYSWSFGMAAALAIGFFAASSIIISRGIKLRS
jgi:ABC-2 type transport system permease protein